MQLFDILKAKASIPVRDPVVNLFAVRSEKTESVTVYRTPERQVYRCSDEYVYALKEADA